MPFFRLIVFALALFAVCATATGQRLSPHRTNEEHVQQTVATFWKALGDLNANGLKETLDWPNMIIQTQPDKGTSSGTVNMDVATLDAEIQRAMERLPEGRKGDFYGTTVSKIEVRFLNESLAYAYHMCRLGGQAGDKAEYHRGHRNFEAIAVLRTSSEAAKPWKIVLITIPQ